MILDDARYGWPGRPGQPGRPAEPSRRGFSSFALPLPDAPGESAPEPDPTERRDAAVLIGRLPERDAALMRCLALEGRDSEECGGRLGLKPGALRVALHRALQRLARLRLEDER